MLTTTKTLKQFWPTEDLFLYRDAREVFFRKTYSQHVKGYGVCIAKKFV